MKMLGYGEDALTLWALKNKLDVILRSLGDHSEPSECKVFFRPSFGRRGGNDSPQFGEFDFIVLSSDCLYLGESKWHRSPELSSEGFLELRPEQLLRHKVFTFYVKEWAFGNYSTWGEFVLGALEKTTDAGINKPLAPENSLLSENLMTVLDVIKNHFTDLPSIRNILLYLYDGLKGNQLPAKSSEDFLIVSLDYSADAIDHFIRL